jgi:acetyltransferase-like isoleucine patch superfamily enzyme
MNGAMGILKEMANYFRNFFLFGIRFPWVKIGNNVHCQLSTHFWSPHKDITIGDNVGIGFNCIFQSDINIGNNVLIASSCAFVNRDDHNYNIVGKTIWESGRGDKHKINIEDDIWIGHGVIIITPARIGCGSIVAAGAVVTSDVPPYSIVGGNPAKIIKMRFNSEEIAEHEKILYG